jgi:integrase
MSVGRCAARTQGRPARRADAGRPEWHDEDLVFAQPNGRPIDKRTDYDDWTRLLKSAGVRHVRLHDGRHTAATLLLSENVHPRVVMELLGHSQMRTTMDIYSHVMPALARRPPTG